MREGQIDVAIVAGPRIKAWPTLGVRMLSRWCADAGLKVGWYGGPDLKVRGVLPLEGSGGIVIVQDLQNRIHRMQAKAIVKVTAPLNFPNPFPGWYSPGLVPESTARKLLEEASLSWQPVVVILGTGNRALRLGSEMLQRRIASRVVCLESVFDHVQGWEVEKRRFEVLGGRFVYGQLSSLTAKSPFLWELKIQDQNGIRVIDTARVISVGPFESDPGYKEYPGGSYLFEWRNSDQLAFVNDVESIMLDEARAVVLASRLLKGLADSAGDVKLQLERALWIAKQKLRELETLGEHRFAWKHEGKWLSPESKQVLTGFPGTPKNLQPGKWLASIECVEAIGCRACERSCPTNAIQIERDVYGGTKSFLIENDCTGCGQCLIACPSQVPVMMDGDHTRSFSHLILPYRERVPLKKGDKVTLLNRKGEVLVQSKIVDFFIEGDVMKSEVPLYKVEVPTHLVWEVRGMVGIAPKPEVESPDDLYQERGLRTEVQIQGDIRRVRENQTISMSLFELGVARPNDILVCEDGSCGLCQIDVDGMKKFACESTIHQGMAIRFTRDHHPSSELCPCSEVTVESFKGMCAAAKPETVEALSPLSEAGRGRCHGIICREACIRTAKECGIRTENREVDWSFPWSDWVLKG